MIIFLVTVTTMLMTFPGARSIGVSLFASAGVAGIVVGFAARPVLSNLLAGIQIALTQPIRIQDAVVVEGEWGWIEEITPLEPYAQGARDSEAGAMVQQIDTPEEPPERTCSRREILWMRADNAASLRGTFIKLVKIGKI